MSEQPETQPAPRIAFGVFGVCCFLLGSALTACCLCWLRTAICG